METLKWTKHFLRDFHQVVEEVFDEIIRIRKNKRKSKEKAIGSGDGGSEDEGGASEGDKDESGDGGIVDCGTADGGVADGDGEGQILGFPDFIAADPQIRGEFFTQWIFYTDCFQMGSQICIEYLYCIQQ